MTNGCFTILNLCYSNSNKVKNDSRTKPSIFTRGCFSRGSRSSTKNNIKILLLGPGESGKSTIFKQVKILYQNGYTKEELLLYKRDIYINLLESVQQMIISMTQLKVQFHTDISLNASEKIMNTPLTEVMQDFPQELARYIEFLWCEGGLKLLYPKLSQISYVICSAPYLFDNINRITSIGYVPTVLDVLKTRIKTTGISESYFYIGAKKVCLMDVGGQISERKKWIHCFENVTSIIFSVSLSDYDQVLIEDLTQSRMLDSFLLFQSIISSKWFQNASMILFLNKVDIFKKKLQTSPLNHYFEDYDGGPNFEAGAAYIRDKFISLNTTNIPIYSHYTCAIDTYHFEAVFSIVKETVLSKVLSDSGIL